MNSLVYLASYDDLANFAINSKPAFYTVTGVNNPSLILMHWLKYWGNLHYIHQGQFEIAQGLRKKPDFDPWCYIAGYPATKDLFWLNGTLNEDLVCFAWIVFGRINGLNKNTDIVKESAITFLMGQNAFIDTNVKYYLGNVANVKYKYKNLNYNTILNYTKNSDVYSKEIVHFFCVSDRFLFAAGDVQSEFQYPTITKSRPVNVIINKNVLLLLNKCRHYNSLNDVKNDIPFRKKNAKLVWRGTTTGPFFVKNHFRASRSDLLLNWYNSHKFIDIALDHICQSSKVSHSDLIFWNKFVKSKMSIKKQLMYKYIISVEGNDVATNLKWIMWSNSLVFMPVPTMETWFMEGRLIPWVHFIPLNNDFSDLYDKYFWCEKNQDKCEVIIKNAQNWVLPFTNDELQKSIAKNVVSAYISHVKFE
jgi:hypothetical protein